MQSIPVEWFAELTLAIGPPTACKAGLTLSLGVKILQWPLYLIRLVSTPICLDGKAAGKQAAWKGLCVTQS